VCAQGAGVSKAKSGQTEDGPWDAGQLQSLASRVKLDKTWDTIGKALGMTAAAVKARHIQVAKHYEKI
jgi:hypothetical protein